LLHLFIEIPIQDTTICQIPQPYPNLLYFHTKLINKGYHYNFFYIFRLFTLDLNKLFGSKAKVDILKYLLFKRQWVSMRALESEMTWTFPAIKKQIDSLHTANVLDIDKESSWRAIRLNKKVEPHIKNIFLHSLKTHIISLFQEYEIMIDKYYFGNKFGNTIDMDLIVLYKNCESHQTTKIKDDISKIFWTYFIDMVSVVFMSASEREKRYRLADRFVLNIMRNLKT